MSFDTLLAASSGEISDFSALKEIQQPHAIPDISVQHNWEIDTVLPQEHRFLADTMMGRVARWLRMTGIDVIHWEEKTADDRILVLEHVMSKLISELVSY